jgi:adenine C2-methylase RlmN of 23S rRNA A2503 and tRNA A37
MKGGNMEQIQQQLEEACFDYAVAIATQAEVEAGAACGQLSTITEEPQTVESVA